jgi:SAM-dependent methyltransferase
MSDRRQISEPGEREERAETAEEIELGIAGEDRDRLGEAEADAAFRWAAGAVKGKDVVVAGCGAGHGAHLLLDAGARSVVGADSSPRSVEMATRLYGERIRFVTAEPTALPLASGAFDVAICIDAPEATLDPEAAIAELRRLLGEGGLLLVSLPLSPSPLEESPPAALASELGPELLESTFANVRLYRRRLSVAATLAPIDGGEPAAIEQARWLAGGEGEDRTVLAAASDDALPELPALASMVSFRDLRAHRDTLMAWEHRARRAEADGSAKHWELVAAREAQRRLRMRLHKLEHHPRRVLSRLLRGKPARLGEGPPIRASEHKPQRWD